MSEQPSAKIIGSLYDAAANAPPNVCSAIYQAIAHIGELNEQIGRLRDDLINTPETADFMAGVPLEAGHQRERWGSEKDEGKTPFDWFWLIGYLAQKAADAAVRGDLEKARHHTISTAAALANWHASLAGITNFMRPGLPAPSGPQGRLPARSCPDAQNEAKGGRNRGEDAGADASAEHK